jgi:hypothetical protein
MPAPGSTVRPCLRPLTRLALLGAAGHAGFEMGSGAGVPLMSVLGPNGAAAAWVGGTTYLWREVGHSGARAERSVALINGVGLAGVLTHYVTWASRPTVLGLPWLVAAEGLERRRMPTYNVILYAWGAASALALWRETDAWAWSLAGLLTTPLLARGARREFRWLRQQARTSPAWWNRSRGLREAT